MAINQLLLGNISEMMSWQEYWWIPQKKDIEPLSSTKM